MSHQYEVTITSVQEVHTLPGIWTNEALRELLAMAEMDDIGQVDDSELPDMAAMALQDLEEQEAGELVLEAVFGDTMRSGVRQNLVDDLQQDRPWEEFANVEQQRGIFVAMVLLQNAFPNRYANPDALRVELTIRASSEAGAAAMAACEPAWLVRLLACGMEESDVLNRLYEEEIRSGPFPDAKGMIWHCQELTGNDEAGSAQSLAIIGPHMWLEPLRKGQEFSARIG